MSDGGCALPQGDSPTSPGPACSPRLPSMRVEYEIHHLVDGSGRLVQILDGGAGGFVETLSAGGHGVGVVVGTRAAEQLAHTTWSPALPTPNTTKALTLRGSARPNPTFQHGTADRFDAVVCIEDEPRRVTLRHGVALRDALAEVARIAVQEHVPLLSLQCPAQIPPPHLPPCGRGRPRPHRRQLPVVVARAAVLDGPCAAAGAGAAADRRAAGRLLPRPRARAVARRHPRRLPRRRLVHRRES